MSNPPAGTVSIEGQLSDAERELLTREVLTARKKPKAILEVGTWLGGGSTLHLLRALHQNGEGHLWGIEADKSIYERMMQNLRQAAPETLDRFTPCFGFSEQVIPRWLAEQGPGFQLDMAFLDGGDNPREQINEFHLIDPFMPVGSLLLAHDARVRKGKWFVPYVSKLDHWESRVMDTSEVGLFYARKLKERPSDASLAEARRCLRRLRLQPVEVIGAILPKSVCGFILSHVPKGMFRRLTRGGG